MPRVRLLPSNHKTYWCTECNRFSLASLKSDEIPLCPKHKTPMVSTPDDPKRTEDNAPHDNAYRHPHYKRGLSREDIEKIILQTESLKAALDFLPDSAPIVVISNTEDEDIKSYMMTSLSERGRNNLWISIPGPRYGWVDKLDPNWSIKFIKAFENCAVAIYVHRPRSIPNKATSWELETLRKLEKQIINYECDIQI